MVRVGPLVRLAKAEDAASTTPRSVRYGPLSIARRNRHNYERRRPGPTPRRTMMMNTLLR